MKRNEFFDGMYPLHTREIVRSCDLCGSVIQENASSVSNDMDLCSGCYHTWIGLNEGHIKNCILNFSIGNVC